MIISVMDFIDKAINAAQSRRDLLMNLKETAPTFVDADNFLLRAQMMDDVIMVFMDVKKGWWPLLMDVEKELT